MQVQEEQAVRERRVQCVQGTRDRLVQSEQAMQVQEGQAVRGQQVRRVQGMQDR